MKLFIDTVNKDFYIALINEEKVISEILIKDLVKKSEALPIEYKKLLSGSNIKTKDIKEIYVVNGPGSFMGIRAGIVFAQTLSMVNNSKLFTCDNLLFISQGKDGEYYIDAKGNKSYIGIIENLKSSITIGDYKVDSPIDYSNIFNTLSLFHEVKDIVNMETLYIKEPQIGGA